MWDKGNEKEIFSSSRIQSPMLPVVGLEEDEVKEHIQNGRPVYVALIEVNRRYGGGEEGGWWYNTEEVVEQSVDWEIVSVEGNINRFRAKYSNAGYGIYSAAGGEQMFIRIADELVVNQPQEVPHYE